jgi:hypothetical protein
MSDGFLAPRFFIDGFEGQGYFNEFAAVCHLVSSYVMRNMSGQ